MRKPSFLQRVKAASKYVFSGYDATKNTRYRGRRGTGLVRSEELELNNYDRKRIISTLLDFRRNNPVVASIARLRKTDVVGRGIIPQPSTGDDQLDNLIETKWKKFAERPEISGQMDMREVQQQLALSTLFYGDSALILVDGGMIQFIDGAQIGNTASHSTSSEESPWQNGVKINPSNGMPTAYNVGRMVNGNLANAVEISANRVISHFIRQRHNQYRGIPELAPVVNTLQDCDEYDKVEMIAAKVSASLSVAVKREDSYNWQIENQLNGSDQDDIGALERFEPGQFHYMEPGEDISVISSGNRPNVDGIQWVSYLLRKVGSAVGIPLEFLLMEIGGSSFSASQGVVLQYQQTIESYQNDLIKVMNRVYQYWLAHQIASGEIKVDDIESAFRVRWQRPAFRWINRAAQVKADLDYYRLGAVSLDDIVAPFGYTAEDVLMRKAQNIAKAKQIAEAQGIDDWHDLLNPYPTSISGSLENITGHE